MTTAVCVPVATATAFEFAELEVVPAAQPHGVAPAGVPTVQTRTALSAPCVIPCFGRVLSSSDAATTSAWLYPARCSARRGVVLDGGTDVAPHVLPRSTAVVDCAPCTDAVVGLKGLAIFPYVREPSPAQTLSCAAYLDDAGEDWATQPAYAPLLQFMRDNWAVLQPLLQCDAPETYPLAVLRVVADVPAHTELLALFNGFCFLGRRSITTRATPLKLPEGVALLRSRATSMADVARVLASQTVAVNASAYRTLLTSEATSAERAEQQRHALLALRAAVCAPQDATAVSLPMLLPVTRPATVVQLPDAGIPCNKRARVEPDTIAAPRRGAKAVAAAATTSPALTAAAAAAAPTPSGTFPAPGGTFADLGGTFPATGGTFAISGTFTDFFNGSSMTFPAFSGTFSDPAFGMGVGASGDACGGAETYGKTASELGL